APLSQQRPRPAAPARTRSPRRGRPQGAHVPAALASSRLSARGIKTAPSSTPARKPLRVTASASARRPRNPPAPPPPGGPAWLCSGPPAPRSAVLRDLHRVEGKRGDDDYLALAGGRRPP